MNFVCGGLVGDFINSLYAVKRLSSSPCNLYISNFYGGDGFSKGIETAYKDLKELVYKQAYIKNFEIVSEFKEDVINLNSWRHNINLYRNNWTQIYNSTYNLSTEDKFFPYLDVEPEQAFKDYIIIHRSKHRHSINFPWDKIIEKNKVLFVTFDKNEIANIPNNSYIDICEVDTFYDYARILKGSKGFVGNQSSPLALAFGLGVKILAELNGMDSPHYFYDDNYISNFFYISNLGKSKIDNISNFISL